MGIHTDCPYILENIQLTAARSNSNGCHRLVSWIFVCCFRRSPLATGSGSVRSQSFEAHVTYTESRLMLYLWACREADKDLVDGLLVDSNRALHEAEQTVVKLKSDVVCVAFCLRVPTLTSFYFHADRQGKTTATEEPEACKL